MTAHATWTPPVPYATQQPWTNWGGNQSCTPAYTVSPRTEREVLEAVRFAVRENLPVRAVGTGHSFTPIVQTGGVLAKTDQLTGITGIDTARQRVRMMGGTKISDIGPALWEHGLSLRNQGDIDKQAICGALATATHGSGAQLTSFSPTLRWVRLVTGHGEVVEIGEDDLHRLRAAQVAIGTLGIMTEVELQVQEAYYLKEEITYPAWDELKADIPSALRANRHFSFLWAPHDDSPALYELPTPAGLPMSGRSYTKKYVEVDVPDEETGVDLTEGARTDRAYRIYAGGFMIPFHELEYYVPAERGIEAVEAIQDLMRTRFPEELYPLETRWVKGDDAYLSPFYGRDTTVLSVSGAPGADYWPYLRAVDSLLQDFDARCHWGKINFFTRERVERLFPEFDRFAQVRAELDPRGVFLNDNLRSLLT